MRSGCCPACGRTDAKAGAFWRCSECTGRMAAGFRWWDIWPEGALDDDEPIDALNKGLDKGTR